MTEDTRRSPKDSSGNLPPRTEELSNKASDLLSFQARPMMVYDGECEFCCRWIERWKGITGDRVYYVPYQKVRGLFPSIPAEQFEHAVQLITPDGKVYSAAEAVLRTIAMVPGREWVLTCYQKVPLFKQIAELAYWIVARNRKFFSKFS